MDFNKSITKVNLAKAFAGECQAAKRYNFLTEMLLKQGYYEIAANVEVLARNEHAHAKVYYDLVTKNTDNAKVEIKGDYPFESGDIQKLLCATAKAEGDEADDIYPHFAEVAKKEGFPEAQAKFELIAKVENCHRMMVEDMLNQLKTQTLYKKPNEVKWKCAHCGHEYTSAEAWKICPLCNHPQGFVMLHLES